MLKENFLMKGKQTLWIGIVLLLVVIVLLAGYYIYQQKQDMSELVQQFDLEKEALGDEFNELSTQYVSLQFEGNKFSVSNDSLVSKLESEQVKVQRLMEELRTVKSSNARRVSELKNELETLKRIMRGYIQQIDSLNQLNQVLTQENKQVTQKYRQSQEVVSLLSKEKGELSERVSLASKLDAGNISARGITNKNKATNQINKIDQLAINFTINKNITAPVGEKDIYIRIQKPDDDVLIKSKLNVFTYENKEINYSSKRTIEYTGEEMALTIYWKVEEFLSPGTYRVFLFADGNQIGSHSFKLEK
ncbi:hypothetical protein AwDysgo_11610 [Bacteroidales bacterium]|nr:hypothetical protein AwDysgo_11610 [Bacteroidales bacterium]